MPGAADGGAPRDARRTSGAGRRTRSLPAVGPATGREGAGEAPRNLSAAGARRGDQSLDDDVDVEADVEGVGVLLEDSALVDELLVDELLADDELDELLLDDEPPRLSVL